MKKIDINEVIERNEHEINENATYILDDLRILNRQEIRDLIGLYDEPGLVEYSGIVYLRSAAVPFAFSDNTEANTILRAIEDMNKKSRSFSLEHAIEYADEVVWCSVMWPIENWFRT